MKFIEIEKEIAR